MKPVVPSGKLDALREWGYLLLRASLGIIFAAHGAQKLFGWFGGHGFAATLQFFSSELGIPAPLAAAAILTELLGGLAVLLGVFSRSAAVGLASIMVVAAIRVHLGNGFFLGTAPGAGDGIEYNVALFGMAMFVALAGPGRFAAAGDPEGGMIERAGRTARAWCA